MASDLETEELEDAIERQAAEIERLRAEKSQMLAVLAECVAAFENYKRRLDDQQDCYAVGAARHILRSVQ